MLRKGLAAMLLCGAIAFSAQGAEAQDEAFNIGTTYVGPTIGLGGLGSASMAFGGRFERGIKKIPDLGSGTLGILFSFDYYSWSSSGTFSGTTWDSSVKYIPLGATANYHFPLENKKIDPFVGIGLGYQIVSTSCNYTGAGFSYDCGSGSYNSSLYFIGRAGGQYHVNQNVGIYADVGAGAATLSIGAMWRLQ